MDYKHLFSSDVPSFMRSPVREIFRKVDLSAICSFAGGYPAAVTFPVEDLRTLPGTVLDKYGTKALQYGATQGVTELREAIAARYGVPVSQVQITTSSQQGIDVCTRILADPGDVILTTEPTYLGALQSFKAYRADVRPIQWYMREREGIISQTVVSDDPSQSRLAPSSGPSLLCGRGWPQVFRCHARPLLSVASLVRRRPCSFRTPRPRLCRR